VFWFVAVKWHSVTGGEDGLLNIQRRAGLASRASARGNEALHYFALAVFVVVALLLWRLVHSPYGRVLAPSSRTRRAPRSWATTLALQMERLHDLVRRGGLAGALFAMAQQSAYPNVMSLHNSGFVVMMVLVGGGLVSFWGPVVGAAFFILARDLLRRLHGDWLLWYGLLFMAMVLFKPEGIVGMWRMPGRRRWP
jgi:branched-chain amino acid transport system permease protein